MFGISFCDRTFLCRYGVFPRVNISIATDYFVSRQSVAKAKRPCVTTQHFVSRQGWEGPEVSYRDRVLPRVGFPMSRHIALCRYGAAFAIEPIRTTSAQRARQRAR